jgi:hypothetical protein
MLHDLGRPSSDKSSGWFFYHLLALNEFGGGVMGVTG